MKRWLRYAAALWLLLGLLAPSLALAASPRPAAEIIHVVQPGDTLGELAERYGTSVQAIAAANALANPDLIHVGEQLLIPASVSQLPATLPGPLTALSVSPLLPTQGDTVTVAVEASEPLTLTGDFAGHVLHWVAEETSETGTYRYWALAGVHALAKPGPHALTLEALDAQGQKWTASTDLFVQGGDFDTTRIVLPPAASKLLEPELLRRERERLAVVWGESAAQPLWQGEFVVPVRSFWPITSAFGQRRAYNSGPASSYHEGVDYGAKQGAVVLAPAAGRVVLAEALTVRGNAIILDHGAGVHSGYWHLWQIFVEEGDEVMPGDPLGRVGNTGLSTGAHLHWELRIGAVAVNPLPWTREAMPQIESES